MTIASVEGRRSPRILLQVPLLIHGNGQRARAHTAVVNRHGALVLSPLRLPEDAFLKAENVESGAILLFRVVCCGGEELPGLYKMGIESLGDASGFWGSEFESQLEGVAAPSAA